jgi:hypothetical protein
MHLHRPLNTTLANGLFQMSMSKMLATTKAAEHPNPHKQKGTERWRVWALLVLVLVLVLVALALLLLLLLFPNQTLAPRQTQRG